MTTFRHLGDQELTSRWRVTAVAARFSGPDGVEFERFVVRSPGAVSVVPLLDDHSVVLVRQYRASIDALVLEIPAGIRDVEGEHPEQTAQRELAEEAGFRARELHLLTVFHPTTGLTDSATHVYLGTGLEAVPRNTQGPEEEHMTVERVPLERAVEMVESGTITDAKTIIGLLLAQRHLRADARG